MALELSIRKLKKYLASEPSAKSKLAARVGIASTSTIDKWIDNGEIPKLKKMLVLVAIKEMERKK